MALERGLRSGYTLCLVNGFKLPPPPPPPPSVPRRRPPPQTYGETVSWRLLLETCTKCTATACKFCCLYTTANQATEHKRGDWLQQTCTVWSTPFHRLDRAHHVIYSGLSESLDTQQTQRLGCVICCCGADMHRLSDFAHTADLPDLAYTSLVIATMHPSITTASSVYNHNRNQ